MPVDEYDEIKRTYRARVELVSRVRFGISIGHVRDRVNCRRVVVADEFGRLLFRIQARGVFRAETRIAFVGHHHGHERGPNERLPDDAADNDNHVAGAQENGHESRTSTRRHSAVGPREQVAKRVFAILRAVVGHVDIRRTPGVRAHQRAHEFRTVFVSRRRFDLRVQRLDHGARFAVRVSNRHHPTGNRNRQRPNRVDRSVENVSIPVETTQARGRTLGETRVRRDHRRFHHMFDSQRDVFSIHVVLFRHKTRSQFDRY